MSGFSSDWLALREPADGAARSAALVASVAAFASGAKSLTVLDLGAGTGSTLRALSPHLPTAQRWVLVDHDASLVAAGKHVLTAWAETAARTDGADETGSADRAGRDQDGPAAGKDDGLTLRVGGQPVAVSWRQADLARADWPALLDGVDLVTASALFDLVSTAFIDGFATAVSAAGAAVYVALDVDGTTEWSPAHADDAEVADAFRRHQGIDKGFGPALGPEATSALTRALEARGYAVRTEKSPWRLRSDHAGLITALAAGWADAAGAAGLDETVVGRWLAARRTATGCVIGHTDLFAVPPAR